MAVEGVDWDKRMGGDQGWDRIVGVRACLVWWKERLELGASCGEGKCEHEKGLGTSSGGRLGFRAIAIGKRDHMRSQW